MLILLFAYAYKRSRKEALKDNESTWELAPNLLALWLPVFLFFSSFVGGLPFAEATWEWHVLVQVAEQLVFRALHTQESKANPV